MCLTTDEDRHIKKQANRAERVRCFTRLWTRKEALGKYIGCGIDESILRADLLHWPQGAKAILASRRVSDIANTEIASVASGTRTASYSDATRDTRTASSSDATRSTSDTASGVPQITTYDLHEACMSVCGHGEVHVSCYSLDEVIALATLAPTTLHHCAQTPSASEHCAQTPVLQNHCKTELHESE
jgi:phosphopantetheinyl transferase (holo-ACP synthase)